MNLDEMLNLLSRGKSKQAAKARQVAVWRNQPVDRLPIIFGVPVPELEGGIHFDMEACFHDPAKMLHEHLYEMIAVAMSPADGVPSVRANTGTGTLPTIFGLSQMIFPDKMPWLKERLTKQQISRLEPEDFTDVANRGIMPQVLDYQRYFHGKLNGTAAVYLSDTQGPFDIAHLVRGDDLLTDLFDDPPFVHHLMELTTTVYIAATKLMKNNLGEPFDGGHHSNGLVMANGGVRICEDTPTLLSREQIDQFVAPYTERALSVFGGGWIHYCGRNDHLFFGLLDQPDVRGFNFGNPETNDLNMIMGELARRGKVYYGGWNRLEEENLEDYFNRIVTPLEGAKQGLIFCPDLRPEELKQPEHVIETWDQIQ
jgi:hypothetical protein